MSEVKELDEERKYLEDQLTRRFNFFFAFAGAVAAALTTIHDVPWVPALLLLSAIISLLFWRALFRTHVLVREVIRLTDRHDDYPLTKARTVVKKHFHIREANHYVAQWIPGVITVSFVTGAIGTLLWHWLSLSNFWIAVSTCGVFVFGVLCIYRLDCVDKRKQKGVEKDGQSEVKRRVAHPGVPGGSQC